MRIRILKKSWRIWTMTSPVSLTVPISKTPRYRTGKLPTRSSPARLGELSKGNIMKKYKCTFRGQEKRAIGIASPVTEIVQTKNKIEAHMKLFDKYELVLDLKINGRPHNITLSDYLNHVK